MKILHITNNYPTKKHPIFGIFVKEQIDSLTNAGVENHVFFINGRELGKKAYLKGVVGLRKVIKNGDFDIMHCHHVLSALILLLTFSCFKNKKIVSYQNDPDREGGVWLYKLVSFFLMGAYLKTKKQNLYQKKLITCPMG